MSLSIYQKARIGYFGAEESFTHLAALKRFGQKYLYISEPLISKIFEDIMEGAIDFGVAPIENSTGGTVYDTIDELVSDRFSQSNMSIGEELYFPIILNLMSKSGLAKIQKVYSHPFPVQACREWVKMNLPAAEIIAVSSTSAAAKMASNEKNAAAIASAEAAKTYGLNLIARNIGQKEPNITHFFVLSKAIVASRQKKKKTAVAFSLLHKPGTLYAVLGTLAKANINLTRIISRPIRGEVGNYKFFIEFEGDMNAPKVKKALTRLDKQTTWINIISSYPTIKLK